MSRVWLDDTIELCSERFDLFVGRPLTQAPIVPPALPEREQVVALFEAGFGQATGFAGVDIPLRVAMPAAVVLNVSGSGYAIPTAYHTPQIDFDASRTRALPALKARQTAHPSERFSPSVYVDQNPYFWIYRTDCPRWQDEDRIPGALFVAIDKLDGAPWSDDAQRKLWHRTRGTELHDPRPRSVH